MKDDKYGKSWNGSTEKPTKERRYPSHDQRSKFLANIGFLFKLILFIGILILMWVLNSCERDTLRDYAYLPEQPYILEINVIPLDDVEINLTNLILEVNADYLNRYELAAEFSLQPAQALGDDIIGKETPGIGRIFLPQQKRDAPNKLNLWVIPDQNIIPGVGGYAINQHNMVVRESNLYGTTVPHEIGHLLGLGHVKLSLNVMQSIGNSEQRADPRSFVPEQIDTMLLSLRDEILPIKSIIYN